MAFTEIDLFVGETTYGDFVTGHELVATAYQVAQTYRHSGESDFGALALGVQHATSELMMDGITGAYELAQLQAGIIGSLGVPPACNLIAFTQTMEQTGVNVHNIIADPADVGLYSVGPSIPAAAAGELGGAMAALYSHGDEFIRDSTVRGAFDFTLPGADAPFSGMAVVASSDYGIEAAADLAVLADAFLPDARNVDLFAARELMADAPYGTLAPLALNL